MRKAHKRGLGAALTLAAVTLIAMATPAALAATSAKPAPFACQSNLQALGKSLHIAGIVPLADCSVTNGHGSNPARGAPPLLFNVNSPGPGDGGQVMMTAATGPLIVTPIFWAPADHPIAASYESLLLQYLGDVAADSGKTSNVYSVLNEYYGTNGQIHYNVRLGTPIYDSSPLPASGCIVASTDTSGIYADGSGYNACLDDAQVTGEIDNVSSAAGLPHNLTHIYVMYLPKHVEACFGPGPTTTSANACTINYQPSAAFCAYHTIDSTSAIYANMPFPIYHSGAGHTCSTDSRREPFGGVVESVNGNPDADTEISPTSHEISEAITDPDTNTGWYDQIGFEIGDECAYVWGFTRGAPGALFNQVINGHLYLTQEEFSNADFAVTGAGCVQNVKDEAK
jgi:hypothetical protein